MFLLFTHSQDFYNIDLVANYLHQKGHKTFRINTDEFPSKFQINWKTKIEHSCIYYNGHEISLKEIKAIWIRKFWGPRYNYEIDEQYGKYANQESIECLEGLFYQLTSKFCLDPLHKIKIASNKMLQLSIADQIDLLYPETLITNQPEKLKEFYYQNQEELIVKMQTALSCSMNSEGDFFYTSKVTEEHIEDADTLELCPLTFQKEIKKEYELRIIYVNGKFFTGKLSCIKSLSDTRTCTKDAYQWEKYEIPNELKIKLKQLMNKLYLNFGAIDVIKSDDGKYYFLEVNPTGEWGMLQKELNLPIAEEIAETLIQNATL
jgi:glutathione synthase/RimK-type ligase-like ATP-grasp enzyme